MLVGLYEEPERPDEPLQFINKFIGAPGDLDVNKLQVDYDKLKDENE